MSHESRIVEAKTYADRLQETIRYSFGGCDLKRNRALEQIAKWYCYQNYSDLRSSQHDRAMPKDYWSLILQVLSIVELHPGLGFTDSDLVFNDERLALLSNKSMQKAQVIVAATHGDTTWSSLILRAVPDDELNQCVDMQNRICAP